MSHCMVGLDNSLSVTQLRGIWVDPSLGWLWKSSSEHSQSDFFINMCTAPLPFQPFLMACPFASPSLCASKSFSSHPHNPHFIVTWLYSRYGSWNWCKNAFPLSSWITHSKRHAKQRKAKPRTRNCLPSSHWVSWNQGYLTIKSQNQCLLAMWPWEG